MRGAFFEAHKKHRSDWQWFEVPATQIPRITPAFLAQEQRALGPRMFAQEYMCEFTETEGALFTFEQIQAIANPAITPLFGVGGTYEERSLKAQLAAGGMAPIFGR